MSKTKSMSPASAQATVRSTPSFNQKLIPSGVKSLRAHLSNEGEEAAIRWLAKSIQQHTQLVPIVADGEKIIDGVRRLRACELAGTKPWIVQLKDVTKGGTDDAWNALNFEGRRHLSVNERALLAMELSKGQQVGSNQHSKATAAAVGRMTQGEAAQVLGVSTDLVQKAKRAVEMAEAAGCKEEVMTSMRAGASIPQVIRRLEVKEVKKVVDKIARKNGAASMALDDLIARGVKLSFVLADPPWNYGQLMMTSNGAPHRIYPTMPTSDIEAMPIADVVAKDAVLWLWVPNCLLLDGLKVMKAWGFDYVTTAVWTKNKAAPSQGAVLPKHETLLVGKRGAGLEHEGNPMKSWYFEPRKAHSQKPVAFAQEAEQLYPNASKIELFSRSPRLGWLAHGNQAQANGSASTARTQPAKTAAKKKPAVKRPAKAKVAARKR